MTRGAWLGAEVGEPYPGAGAALDALQRTERGASGVERVCVPELRYGVLRAVWGAVIYGYGYPEARVEAVCSRGVVAVPARAVPRAIRRALALDLAHRASSRWNISSAWSPVAHGVLAVSRCSGANSSGCGVWLARCNDPQLAFNSRCARCVAEGRALQGVATARLASRATLRALGMLELERGKAEAEG